MAHDVFISHSSKDKNVADALCSAMETAGIRCWVAPRDVAPGSDWAASIVEALGHARVMVLIFSSHAADSPQVKKELSLAASGDVVIVPMKLDDTPLEGMMQYYLSDTHWLDAVNPPTEEQILELVATVRALVKSRGGGARVVAWGQRTLRQPKRVFVAAATAVMLAILAVGVAVFAIIGGGEPPPPPPPEPDDGWAQGSAMRTASTLSFTYELKDMAVADGIAYFACDEGGVEWGEVAGGAMRQLGTYASTDFSADLIAAYGDVVYVMEQSELGSSDTSSEVVVLSFADRTAPVVLSTYTPRSFTEPGLEAIQEITASGRWLALSTWDKAELVDVSDPSNPRYVWTWETDSQTSVPCDAAFVDDRESSGGSDVLALGTGIEGVRFFDLADPRSPQQVGSYKADDWIVDLTVQDGIVYAAAGTGGIVVVDVTDSREPRPIAIYEIPGYVSTVEVWEDTLFFGVFEQEAQTVTGAPGVPIQNYLPTNPGVGRVRIPDFEADTVQRIDSAAVRSPATGLVAGLAAVNDTVLSMEQGVGVSVYHAVEAPPIPEDQY